MSEYTLIEKMLDTGGNNPGWCYSPLYIYGNREKLAALLTGFQERFRAEKPNSYAVHLKLADFRRDIMDAVCNNSLPDYKRALTSCDLLILENIEEAAGSDFIMEVLYIIIDRLLERSSQIIITGCCPPRSIPKLTDRIATQIEGGIICGSPQCL